MPNAWFYYVLPLGVSIASIIAGWVTLRRFRRGDRDKHGKEYGKDVGCLGILAMAFGSALGLAIVLTSPTPWKRKRIFDHVLRTPPERIQKFIVRPGNDKQRRLTASDVTIEDPARIRHIATLLSSAGEVSPNHPQTRWSAHVEMVTRDGTFYFNVTATNPGDVNGTIVNFSSDPEGAHWNLGDFRADGLEIVLEDAVKQPPTR